MINFFKSDLEILLTIILISLFLLLIYDLIKKHGKVIILLKKIKLKFINIQNGWSNSSLTFDDKTKDIEIDFILEIFNNSNNYNSIYNINIYQKSKFKYIILENHYLNLSETMKSISGTTSYEKLKYINLLPFEYKEFNIRIKLNTEEYKNNKYIYIKYKIKGKNKRIKLNIKKY